MSRFKRFLKQNTQNKVLKALAGFGRSMHRLYENRNHDIFSNGEVTVLKKMGKLAPSVIIDGGANIGTYSLEAARACQEARIFALEPVKDTFEKLQTNVASNDRIITFQKGFYNENKHLEINVGKSHTHSSLYAIEGLKVQPVGKETIALIKGDDFLKENNIDTVDFLKIDVEGAEYDALLGFEESIQAGRIRAIQFEYGYINITTKKLLIDFYKFFEKHGYVLGKIFPKRVAFRAYDFKYEDFLGPNFLAVKADDTTLLEVLKKA